MSALSGTIGGGAGGAAAGSYFGPLGTAIGGGLGAVMGFFGGSAEDEARAARRTAALESARRQAVQQHFTEGQARANAGASGVDMNGGSMAQILTGMHAEFQRQYQMNVDVANRGADIAGDTAMWGDFANVGKGLFGFAAANNFFRGDKTPPQTYTPGSGMPLWR